MKLKTLLFAVGGGVIGWKVGERVSPGLAGEGLGALVGAGVGYWVGKKI